MFIDINPSLKLKATVVFEDPRWVGIIERTDAQGIAEARVIFDSEPSEAELQDYVTKNYESLEFSKPVSPAVKAQEAMKRLLEQRKQQSGFGMKKHGQQGGHVQQKASQVPMKNKDRHRGVR
jgi:hypothetical protein